MLGGKRVKAQTSGEFHVLDSEDDEKAVEWAESCLSFAFPSKHSLDLNATECNEAAPVSSFVSSFVERKSLHSRSL